ncbi:UbiX family flavin prenyltransferase [Campylobacter sp. FMV-PI01]|uniref:UbiX family flavin prenyltransferase n=1 Tax=Campylobacter portucalensis TaxID=2608384 RepID=A0A6L5WHU8_9BACT|nr:UbiX family flavin prenyltransferase [Campylobacter portucalensis]MSN96828.1 UbiX family flavin prenyltransferase [Campylobacter portucalensis]
MKILLCITGASLVNLGLKMITHLENECDLFVILSKNAKIVLEKENSFKFNINSYKNTIFFNDDEIYQAPASGSFGIDKTIIAPCSINTLAKISNGISDTLITRAAAVSLKEQKKLILGVREMPFSAISLEQMSKLSNLGVVISPPILGSYAGFKSVEEIENFIIGKWLDLLEIKHNLYKKWS